jgi:hypothetical protein
VGGAPLTSDVMQREQTPKRRSWPKFTLVTSAVLTLVLFVAWHTRLGFSTQQISSLEFVNRSDRTVTNLDLDFICIVPSSGPALDEYSRRFSRHFAEVLPGSSVVVRTRTPMLMLTGLQGWHNPRIYHIG